MDESSLPLCRLVSVVAYFCAAPDFSTGEDSGASGPSGDRAEMGELGQGRELGTGGEGSALCHHPVPVQLGLKALEL